MTAPTSILLTGMFDMDNYGDLLFPLVAGDPALIAAIETELERS